MNSYTYVARGALKKLLPTCTQPSAKQLAAAKSAAQKAIVQRQIDATDRQIDQLVYQLYGLTDEEVALIEEELTPTIVQPA